ncbi:MAG: amino acid ABC transporter permease [Clostridia bacterium]|nr:amino acid ABC transporter permease [Clostridia bacterium]
MFVSILLDLLQGFGVTLCLFAVTLILSLPLGLAMSFGSMSKFKPLKYFVKGVIWVIRGTPLMLQILLVSFIPMYLFGIMNKDLAIFFGINTKTLLFVFVAVAFIINYSCYFSEIFRSGIESIPQGQYEAGKVLGMTKRQVFKNVIFMQVVKRIIPPMSNEIITLVKDTALAQILGVVDLLNSANHAVNEFVVLSPLVYAAVFYLLFNGLLTLLFGFAEKKLSYYKI